MLGTADRLTQIAGVELSVATVSKMVKVPTVIQGEHITYYILPYGKGNTHENREYEPLWQQIQQQAQPDVIHVHGTEFSHGLAYIKACGNERVVVSIQGLKSAYYYYYYGLTRWDIYSHLAPLDLITGSIIKQQQKFKRQSEYEKKILHNICHIIGRTSWDKARTWAINPDAQYHFCNETLQQEFYDGSQWSYSNCSKHTIFLSQAGYPIKGLHQLLRSMPLILRHYPDTRVRVAGGDITKVRTLHDFILYTGYGRIVKSMIRRLNLQDHITFTGPLNAEQIKQEYLRTNVFVCPSTIENSPNSLGEAQLLGTPCIASYVGGIPDMMRGNEDNLYRFEETEMLAAKICRVFADKDKQTDMRKEAAKRHSPDQNVRQLRNIYEIVEQGNKTFLTRTNE